MSLKVLTSIPLLPLSSVPKIQITNKIQIQINTNSSGGLNNNRYKVEERADRQALPLIENKLPKQNRYTRGEGGEREGKPANIEHMFRVLSAFSQSSTVQTWANLPQASLLPKVKCK